MFGDYAKYYNLIYADKPYEREAEMLYEWAGYPQTILEIGCGTGRHAQYWCKHAKIVGIDASKEMIKHAYIHPNIKYYTRIQPVLHKQFDCVMAIFNVVGYLGMIKFSNWLQYLPLKKEGVFIFDVWDAEKMKNDDPKPTLKYFKGGYRVAVPHILTKRFLRIDIFVVVNDQLAVFERHFAMGFFRRDIDILSKEHGYTISAVKNTPTWTKWYKLKKKDICTKR